MRIFPLAQAEELAEHLNEMDMDGLTYEAVACARGRAVIEMIDEHGESAGTY